MRPHFTFLFLIFVAVIFLFGCTPGAIPLKGNYANSSTELNSTKSADSIWQNIAELFTRNGLPVKSIDRNKGVIASKKTSFISVYTLEDENGQLQNPEAWVVLPRTIGKNKEWKQKVIYCKWSILVTETEGKTKIKIEPLVLCTFYPNMFTSMEDRGQSTGRLEVLIKRLVEVQHTKLE